MNNTYLTVTEIATYFNTSNQKINKIFLELTWAKKQDRWWIATELGLENGAKQEYNAKNKQKYIKWSSLVKKNPILIEAIEKIREPTKPKRTLDKIKKGKAYEELVANYYKALGYTVWEHGKELGVKDHGIDIIVKQGRKVLFLQCKHWNKSNKYKITHRHLKSMRQDVSDYIEKKSIFSMYDIEVIYVVSDDIFDKSAYYYLNEHKENIKAQIIPF